jgi:hypothetical protein
MTGIEPVTPSLPRKYSTSELHRLTPTTREPVSIMGYPQSAYIKRAGDEVRTRDLQLGRLPLYQLSYSRFLNAVQNYENILHFTFVGETGFEPVKT